MDQGDIVKAHCNRCSGERNHFIIYVHEGEWTEDLHEVIGDEAITEATLEFGHASTHRNYNPTRQDITQVLDIAENIIQSIYVSAEQAKALKRESLRVRIPKKVINLSDS